MCTVGWRRDWRALWRVINRKNKHSHAVVMLCDSVALLIAFYRWPQNTGCKLLPMKIFLAVTGASPNGSFCHSAPTAVAPESASACLWDFVSGVQPQTVSFQYAQAGGRAVPPANDCGSNPARRITLCRPERFPTCRLHKPMAAGLSRAQSPAAFRAAEGWCARGVRGRKTLQFPAR